eukprot:scaffold32629_cov118-Isochrysis_galbana.AAC.2
MKKIVNNFVSKEQLSFVPKRLIGEATHLLKLIQAYLEEEGRDGLLLALDWEKAFNRVSWDYVPPSPRSARIRTILPRVGPSTLQPRRASH